MKDFFKELAYQWEYNKFEIIMYFVETLIVLGFVSFLIFIVWGLITGYVTIGSDPSIHTRNTFIIFRLLGIF